MSVCTNCSFCVALQVLFCGKEILVCFPYWQAAHEGSSSSKSGKPFTRLFFFIKSKVVWWRCHNLLYQSIVLLFSLCVAAWSSSVKFQAKLLLSIWTLYTSLFCASVIKQNFSSNNTLYPFSRNWPTLQRFWLISGTYKTSEINFKLVLPLIVTVPLPFTTRYAPFAILTLEMAVMSSFLKSS